MRKEAVLDGDAIARTFEVVLKKVFTSVETLVGTNSSNFANGFCMIDRPLFPTNAKRCTLFAEIIVEFPPLSLFLKVRHPATFLLVQMFERFASRATRMCVH